MFNTFSLPGFQCLDGLLLPEPLLLSAGQKLWLQKASFQSFSLISGYSFFNSLLLALFQALINLLSSVLDCAWNITYTWSMSWFHSSRIIPYPEAICSHIPFALSEIGLSMTFLRYLTTMFRCLYIRYTECALWFIFPFLLTLLYHGLHYWTSVLFLFLRNSSPTCRGRRILAILC